MSAKIRFTSATATGLVLAKVGHPQRDEPLQTSKEVFKIEENDQEPLTAIFLKPFKNLTAHRFSHHSSLDQHEMNAYAAAIFASDDGLLEKGCDIAKRLYAKSNHPNIKSGDLCISLIKDIEIDGETDPRPLHPQVRERGALPQHFHPRRRPGTPHRAGDQPGEDRQGLPDPQPPRAARATTC